MIFENNYAWPGTTAIIYNLELDKDFLEFYLANPSNTTKSKILLPANSTLCDIGIDYKKESDTEWTGFSIFDDTVINSVKNNTSAENAINSAKSRYDKNKYIVSAPIGYAELNFICPLKVVIKNLEEGTTYDIRSYCFKDNWKTCIYFNECKVTTFTRQDIYYECTGASGGNDSQNTSLMNKINEGCEIVNAMTDFKRSTAPYDSCGSRNGGQFTVKYDSTMYSRGIAADSSMTFGSTSPNVSTILHEMAHNLMKDLIDERKNEEAYNKIVKFMEFATHSPKATWRWISSHNYPVISSASYADAYLYVVAAAMRVCRDASNRL